MAIPAWTIAVAPTAPSTDALHQGIHHALCQAVDGVAAGFGVAELLLQRRLQHRDFKDADAAPGPSQSTAKVSGKTSKCLSQAFVDDVQGSVNRGN